MNAHAILNAAREGQPVPTEAITQALRETGDLGPPRALWYGDGPFCRKCGGEMKPSKAIAQAFSGLPDFTGKEVVTISPGGPGRLIDCMKCEKCGHSVTPNV